MAEPVEARYARQSHVFPTDRRQSSALAVLGAEGSPFAGAALLAGAAAMGLPMVGSDFHGPCRPDGHWLLGEYPEMVARLNEDTHYEYVDPEVPATDVPQLLTSRSNAWLVVVMNRPELANAALQNLAEADVQVPVLLLLVGPGGFVVQRHPDPASAFEVSLNMPPDGAEEGPPELAIAAAGLALNEVMLAGDRDDGTSRRTVGFYSLSQRRRVGSAVSGPAGDLFGEVATGPGATSSFAGRRFALVGAGALGNWTALALAMEDPSEAVIFDGDPEVSATNLNRQVLLVGTGGRRPKVDVLVRELRELCPTGSFRGVVRFVRKPDDLEELAGRDALLCVPDNDQARNVCDDARREAGVLFATAGSSALGGQVIVRRPWHGCLRCMGIGRDAAQAADAQSCSLVQNDAVVSSNMVAAGLMCSELRQALAGREPANIRFAGDSLSGNRLVRMISGATCPHVPSGRAMVV